ncbi:MAG: CpsD/CapB family tyrosine-protein kinase [Thermoleophilia bacterium]
MTTEENNGLHLYVHHYPKSLIAESFRTLRTNILLTNIDKGMKTIVVTSAERGEGKSTICANLAVVMAQTEKKVLLLDCDLRLPSLQKFFNIPLDTGVTTFLARDHDQNEFEVDDEVLPGLTVVGTGPPPPNPSEFLSSRRFRAFLAKMENQFDSVIIDAPPVGLVSDAAILSAMVDGTILVLDSQLGHRKLTMKAKEALQHVNANIVGMVLNNVRSDRGSYPNYYYR